MCTSFVGRIVDISLNKLIGFLSSLSIIGPRNILVIIGSHKAAMINYARAKHEMHISGPDQGWIRLQETLVFSMKVNDLSEDFIRKLATKMKAHPEYSSEVPIKFEIIVTRDKFYAANIKDKIKMEFKDQPGAVNIHFVKSPVDIQGCPSTGPSASVSLFTVL
jgi:hypothetical protein